jgi:hypothetical protein
MHLIKPGRAEGADLLTAALTWIVLRLGAVGATGNPAEPGSCRGPHHTDRQPFTARWQCLAVLGPV